MTATSVVTAFISSIGGFITDVSENTTIVLIVGVMVAAGICRLAFKTIKRFVH